MHRDLKPQNILRSSGAVRLSDFGLTKGLQQAGLSGMSMTGGHACTPVFMPREQITNLKYVKPVSDVWSMGATIYNLLTGAFPYPVTTERDPIDVILNEDTIPIRKRDATIPKAPAERGKVCWRHYEPRWEVDLRVCLMHSARYSRNS